ncbi:MAG: 4Fe-4S binding protein [Dehalococcoidia bacterium]|nr:4Fe-4S binding protein [Dehalococcoidia bacterium]
MVDLSIDFAGLRLKNPIVAASGPIASTPATIRRCIEHGAGAVTVKSVGLDKENQLLPRPGNWFLDKLGERGGLMHCFSGLLTPEQAAECLSVSRPLADREDARLIGSLYFMGPWTGMPPFPPVSPPAPETLRRMALQMEAAGADAIEVCCNCGLSMKPSASVDFVERSIPVAIEALKGRLKVPFWIKLGFNHDVFWLRDLRTMQKLGMPAVHVYSDLRATFLDIETARPPMALPFGYGHWLRGPANYATYLSAVNSKLQIMSSGGIWTWKDAVERMMCGATLAALESPVQYHGYRVFGDILKGLAGFMERKGYKRASDMVGLAAPHIYNVKEFLARYDQTTGPREAVRLALDEVQCTGCGRCVSCIYEAIVMASGLPSIDNEACERCGVCVTICPADALAIEAS